MCFLQIVGVVAVVVLVGGGGWKVGCRGCYVVVGVTIRYVRLH
jgi:hypothetical protein